MWCRPELEDFVLLQVQKFLGHVGQNEAERFWQALAVICVALTAYSFWIVFELFMQYRNVVPTGA